MSSRKAKAKPQSPTKLSAQPELEKIAATVASSTLLPETMKSSPMIANLENHLKWEKKKVEKTMQQLILAKTEDLTNTLIDIAITERNPNAINTLLDRAFGRARQNIGLDGGATDKPIVFLPAELMAKYEIKEGTKDVFTPINGEEAPLNDKNDTFL